MTGASLNQMQVTRTWILQSIDSLVTCSPTFFCHLLCYSELQKQPSRSRRKEKPAETDSELESAGDSDSADSEISGEELSPDGQSHDHVWVGPYCLLYS
jgi:hypothetical protein